MSTDLSSRRRLVLVGLLVLLAGATALMLSDVLRTLFFAITVAAVARPLYRELTDRGISTWWASLVTTVATFVGMVAVFSPLAIVLYLRRAELVALVRSLPETVELSAMGFTHVVDVGTALDTFVALIRRFAVDVVSLAPILALKLMLFAMVVFALLIRGGEARRAVLELVPSEYLDVVDSLERRARATLYAIYVVQAATALATFFIALPIFWVLGYDAAVSLAVIAATLQFLPIVGPSVLIALLGVWEVVVGDLIGAVVVVLLGAALIAWLPDAVIRPRLARQTTDLPGSVFFVGFVGGLLSLGPVGVIAGPLLVALLVEAVDQLGDEVGARRRGDVQPKPAVVETGSVVDAEAPARGSTESSGP